MEEKRKYHWGRRVGALIVLWVILSEIEVHTALKGNQLFADIAIIGSLVLCFGLRYKGR